MDKVFLDANVLFSAAYRSDAGLVRLWTLKNVELITSTYALQEAEKNLMKEEQYTQLKACPYCKSYCRVFRLFTTC